MVVSSVHSPADRLKGPPPTISSTRSCASRPRNSSVVPTASPTARPRKAPTARSRMLSSVVEGRSGAARAHCFTWRTWSRVSRAFCERAARTRLIASSGFSPNSTSNRAATVPARPRPPLQWTSTSNPSLRRSRMAAPAWTQAFSKSGPGGCPSGMGRCHHSMCRSATALEMSWTRRSRISSSVIRLTTAVAPHFLIRSRSRSRSRSQFPAMPQGYFLPGHRVMPIWP